MTHDLIYMVLPRPIAYPASLKFKRKVHALSKTAKSKGIHKKEEHFINNEDDFATIEQEEKKERLIDEKI